MSPTPMVLTDGALFDMPPTSGAPLTVADIDEWIADIDSAIHPHSVSHTPNEWARAGLGAFLGEEIPYRLWSSAELLATLRRARDLAALQECTDKERT